jgi:4'-phosphopantetheinyl transferase
VDGRRLVLVPPDRAPQDAGSPGTIVELWSCGRLEDALAVESVRNLLDNDEREQAARFHRDDDRGRFVTARAARRVVLASYLGAAPGDLVFATGEHGKPVVAAPSTAPLHFNVSHAGDWVLLAVCSTHPVGVDIERVRSEVSLEELRDWILSPAECAAQEEAGTWATSLDLWRTWVRKEAALKAVGCGLSVPMAKVEGGPPQAAGSRVLRVRTSASEDARVLVDDLAWDDGYVAAIAIDLGAGAG